jgi:hypothetical protein
MSSSASSSRLHQTVSLGGKPIHRVSVRLLVPAELPGSLRTPRALTKLRSPLPALSALAPLTRLRNIPDEQTPTDLAEEYYSQRASKDGLLITEATFIARGAFLRASAGSAGSCLLLLLRQVD